MLRSTEEAGSASAEQKALDRKQEALIRRLVADKCPDQLKLEFACGRGGGRTLIQRETSVRLSLSAVGNYLGLGGSRRSGRSAEQSSVGRRRFNGGSSTTIR